MYTFSCKTAAIGILLFVSLCSWLTSAAAQPVKLARGGEQMFNIDLPGSDIQKIPLETRTGGILDLRKEQCAKACSENKECVAWTYVRPNTIQGPAGNCWLKNSIPAKNNNTCCVSGVIGEAGTDRPGSDYKHFDNINGVEVTAPMCKQACFQEAQCKAWTFVQPNTFQGPKGMCWLKDSVPAPVQNPACISGWFETEVIR